MKKTIERASLQGELAIPGSKSHTIRALLIATLAEGVSVLKKPLFSEDVRACLAVCRGMGAEIVEMSEELQVKGVGKGFEFQQEEVDVLNSGTTLFFAAAIAALQSKPIRLTGDASLCQRSGEALLNALESFGAHITYEEKKGFAPFTICGPLRSGRIKIDCPTSQYLSALLLTLPLADGNFEIETGILKEKPYVDMTKRWLDEQIISYQCDENYKKIFIPGGQLYRPFEKTIPADFSSAAFFLCGAAISGGRLTFTNLDMLDSQGDKAVVYLLEKMGCKIQIGKNRVEIQSGRLKGCDVDMNEIPDALPILAVTACFAEGKTKLFNAAHTRLKETDRISCMTKELKKLGAKITEFPDAMEIEGGGLHGGEVESHGDHRIAMALSMAGLATAEAVSVKDAEAVEVTFPQFYDLLKELSIKNKGES